MIPIVPAGMVYAVAPTAAVIMGDSLMYVVLPVAAVEFGAGEQFGLAASFWIGFALSINRFIRLASNALAAMVYQRLGMRWPFVVSIGVGALTTLAYGLASGLVALLLARALWGVSYSHMRLAAQLTAFGVGTGEMRGRLMGFFNSGQRLGSLVAVTAGAALFQLTSREVTFVALAGVGLVGMLIATQAPDLRPERVLAEGGGLARRLNPWTLAISRIPGYGARLRAQLLSISLMRFATAFGANGLAIATVAPYLAEFADENERVLGGSLGGGDAGGVAGGTEVGFGLGAWGAAGACVGPGGAAAVDCVWDGGDVRGAGGDSGGGLGGGGDGGDTGAVRCVGGGERGAGCGDWGDVAG